jgi:O-antigen/teichoic acid export membrane protein
VLLRSALAYIPAVLLPRVAAFVIIIVATRLLPPYEYGLLSLTVTVGELVEMTVSNWTRIALLRLMSGEETISKGTLQRSAAICCVTLLISVFAILLLTWLIAPDDFVTFATATVSYVVSAALLRFGLTFLQIRGLRGSYILVEVARSVAITALPILAMLHTASFLAASLASSVGTAILATVAVKRAVTGLPDGKSLFSYAEMLSFATPLMTISLMSYAIVSFDRLALEHFHGTAAVGFYVAAYSLARQGIDVIGNAVNVPGFPRLVACYSKGDQHAVGQAIAHQAGLLLNLALPAAAVFIALRAEIISLILPSHYHDSAMVITPLVAVGAVFLGLKNFVFDNVLHLTKQTWLQVPGLFAGATISVLLALLLIPGNPQLGASVAFIGGALIGLLASIAVSRHVLPFPLPWAAVVKAMLTATVSAGAAGGAARFVAEQGTPVMLTLGSVVASIAFMSCFAGLNLDEVRRWIATNR